MLPTFLDYATPYFQTKRIDVNYFYPVAARVLGINPNAGTYGIDAHDRVELDDILLDETGRLFVDAASRANVVYRHLIQKFALDELGIEDAMRPVIAQTYDNELTAIARVQPHRPTLPAEMRSALYWMVDSMRANYVALEKQRAEARKAQQEIEQKSKEWNHRHHDATEIVRRHIDVDNPKTIIAALTDAQERKTICTLIDEFDSNKALMSTYFDNMVKHAIDAMMTKTDDPATASENEITQIIRKSIQTMFICRMFSYDWPVLSEIDKLFPPPGSDEYDEDRDSYENKPIHESYVYDRILKELPIIFEPTTDQIKAAIQKAFPNGLENETTDKS